MSEVALSPDVLSFIDWRGRAEFVPEVKKAWQELAEQRKEEILTLSELVKSEVFIAPFRLGLGGMKLVTGRLLIDLGNRKPISSLAVALQASETGRMVFNSDGLCVVATEGSRLPNGFTVDLTSSNVLFERSESSLVKRDSLAVQTYRAIQNLLKPEGLAFFEEKLFLLCQSTGEEMTEELWKELCDIQ